MKPIEEKVRSFAHDVRNPLGGLRGLAEIMQLKMTDSPDLLKKLEKIIGAANTADKMITDFVDEMKALEQELLKENADKPGSTPQSQYQNLLYQLLQYVKQNQNGEAIKISLEKDSPHTTLIITNKNDDSSSPTEAIGGIVKVESEMEEGGAFTIKLLLKEKIHT